MAYPAINNNNPAAQQYRSNFLTSTHRLRPFPRYLRKPMNHTRAYGVRVGTKRAPNVLPRSRSFHPDSNYLQQRMAYWGFNNSPPTRPSKPSNDWDIRLKIPNQTAKPTNSIARIRRYARTISQKMDQFLTPYGFSAGCVWVGFVTTVIVLSMGIGLGIGLANSHGPKTVVTYVSSPYYNYSFIIGVQNSSNVTIG